MENITVGLISGRHERPVGSYIFEQIEDPTDFAFMKRRAAENGVHLTLMHFDRETGDYIPQEMF